MKILYRINTESTETYPQKFLCYYPGRSTEKALFEIQGRKLRTLNPSHPQHEVAGVCGGIAYWAGIPVWVVRLLTFIMVWFYGFGLIIYIAVAIILPEWPDDEPEDLLEVTGD